MNKKQQALVTYLGWILDESMSGESMTLNVTNKISIYRKNKCLTQGLLRMLCNVLI